MRVPVPSSPLRVLLPLTLLAALALAAPGEAQAPASDTSVQCSGASCAPLVVQQDVAPYSGVTATPKAACGKGDVPESQQGQAASGSVGFLCGLREVSHVGPAATLAFAVYGHCAYYQAGFGKGTVVVDVSRSDRPVVTATLTTPAMQYAHEGLRVHAGRGLLAAMAAGARGEGVEDPWFDAYDLTRDCAHPRLLGSTLLPGVAGHEGTFSHDGRTFYATDVYGGGSVVALDVHDAAHPRSLWTLAGLAAHGLTTSPDGNRLYVSTIATPGVSAVPNALGGCNGVVVLDVRQVQARTPAPRAKALDYFCWQDGIAAQVPYAFSSHGKPYLVVTDEGGSIAEGGVTLVGKATGGHARIVDVSDPRHPKIVSQIITQNQVVNGGHSFHYCTPDREVDPTVIGCTSWMGSGGFRVYDVRDVTRPREIAYYSVPGNTSGSPSFFFPGRAEAWYADENDGLTVVRFTDGVWPFGGTRRTAAAATLPKRVVTPRSLSMRGVTWSTQQQRLLWLCGVAAKPAELAAMH